MVSPSIKIEDGRLAPYHIKWDKYGYELIETVTSKRRGDDNKLTEETYQRDKSCGMFTSVHSLIKSIIQRKMLKGNKKVVSLIDFYKNYKELHKEISQVLSVDSDSRFEAMDKKIKAMEKELAEVKAIASSYNLKK